MFLEAASGGQMFSVCLYFLQLNFKADRGRRGTFFQTSVKIAIFK